MTRALRSLLFVPGDSEKKIARASDCDADALILDLEDSVGPDRKQIARKMVAEALAAGIGGKPLWVRVNPPAEGQLDDLIAVVAGRPAGLVVPKVDHPADLVRLSHILDALERREGVESGIRLLPVATETPRAPFGLGAYADHPLPRLHGLTWGAEDLSTALGARSNRDDSGGFSFTYRMVRSACLMAAKAAGVAAIETLYANFRDEAGLEHDCAAAAREGFTGRVAIHPAQCAVINRAFSPSEEDLAFARKVVAAFDAAPGAGVVGVDGKMLDIPHLKQARQVLAQAETG